VIVTPDNIQALNSPIKLDISGVFPESVDKKRLSGPSTSGYSGGIRSVVCHPTKQFVFVVWAGGVIQVWSYANLRKTLLQKCGSAEAGAVSQNEDVNDEDDGDINDNASSIGTSDTKTMKRKQSVWGMKSSTSSLLTPKAILRPPASGEVQAAGTGGGTSTNTNTAPVLTCDHRGQLAAVIWGENMGGGLCVYDIRSGSILGGHAADNSTATASNITALAPIGNIFSARKCLKKLIMCLYRFIHQVS
jgi:hypothetical protein